jgi:hypothetical protein
MHLTRCERAAQISLPNDKMGWEGNPEESRIVRATTLE